MEKFFQRFISDDKGNITADWVVLVAGVILLSAAVFGAVKDGALNLADGTGDYVSDYDPLI